MSDLVTVDNPLMADLVSFYGGVIMMPKMITHLQSLLTAFLLLEAYLSAKKRCFKRNSLRELVVQNGCDPRIDECTVRLIRMRIAKKMFAALKAITKYETKNLPEEEEEEEEEDKKEEEGEEKDEDNKNGKKRLR
ncbi:hypothetical protein PROFUN_14854 [Planoprotostelium fungivorum]|uniref:Uncharacterized protein n=1 Tax=Planoprotostelium fungivorum TaxID=1890364 RepID=A0A2P6MYP3_9EUKA|nr:hypothetical protein PROFUN_14854 [Planoprotostelium fungivorum]